MRVLIIVNTRARSGSGDVDLYDFIRVIGTAGCEVTLRFLDGGAIEPIVADADVVRSGGRRRR